MFDLEQAIRDWKGPLRKNPAFEDGDIAELESHLREQVERLKAEGLSEEEAFQLASEEIGEPESIGDELYKSRTTKLDATPSWKQKSWIPMMLPNYVKVSLRNLYNHKVYSAINIFGLAVGIACCILILFFVRHELSYDEFHENSERTYRIVSVFDDLSMPTTNLPVVDQLGSDFSTVEVAPLLRTNSTVEYRNQSYREDRIFFAKPSFFEVFTFPLLYGNPETALSEPNTVIISEETAQKYFGDENPVDNTIVFYGDVELTVTGVAEDIPDNSHFEFDFLVSWVTLEEVFSYGGSWGNNSIHTYLLLPKDYPPDTMEAQLTGFLERHAPEGFSARLSLQPMTDIHLHSHHDNELQANGYIEYIYIFSIIAGLILIVAFVNFMNLSTARAAERAKEVGVRKAAGAQRSQLVSQFLAESVLLSYLALLLALVLVWLALPLFNQLSGKALTLEYLGEGWKLAGLIGITGLAGLIAGSYPAFTLSRFKPSTVLKGAFHSTRHGAMLRKGLVVFQFATSIGLIIGTTVVHNQLEFLRDADLGFDQEQVITIPTAGIGDQFEAFKAELMRDSGVVAVARSSEALPSELLNGTDLSLTGPSTQESKSMRAVLVSSNFFETLGVEMMAGRTFSPDFAGDSSAFIINEAAYHLINSQADTLMGSPEETLGRTVESEWLGRGPIIGIARNFNMATLHEQIEPIVFFMLPEYYDNMLIRIQPEDFGPTLTSIGDTWQSFFPNQPFLYSFVDQTFEAAYRGEERLGQIIFVFSVLAIFIACLGLFAMAALTAEQRTKEIGIRKALGATVASIVTLLSKDFIKYVGVAFVIAVPIAWYFMQQWLQDFAYRIDIGAGIFLLAGALALIIALVTISWQSIRAALANPVDSLRSE